MISLKQTNKIIKKKKNNHLNYQFNKILDYEIIITKVLDNRIQYNKELFEVLLDILFEESEKNHQKYYEH